MLSVNHRLKPSASIGKVKKEGKATNSKNFTILTLFRKDKEDTKFAFIVSAKVSKHATIRNKTKRSLSEGVRHNIAFLKKGYDVVIIAKQSAARAYTDEIVKEIKLALNKANLLQK